MNDSRKNIAVLGSTGSIGTQTVDIIRQYPDRFEASVLIAGRNVVKLAEQALQLKPALAVIADESKLPDLERLLKGSGIEVRAGEKEVQAAMIRDDVDTVVTATVGYSGLAPTLAAIAADKDIALANKETLVVAGELVNKALCDSSSRVIPVDSEHSAIYQCLVGEDPSTIEKLIITASGGPFRGYTPEEMAHVTVADALRHPKWKMGAKITIDSATMMNKAFEIIEARWLFGVDARRIEPVVHPQSIVHSMVQFCDGTVKAQLGLPDMHSPIRYALGDASRIDAPGCRMSLADYSSLTFETPDPRSFPCLTLAREVLEVGGTAACTVNAANEVAVAAFLQGRIAFLDIYRVIRATLDSVGVVSDPQYNDYVAVNDQSRHWAEEYISRNIRC